MLGPVFWRKDICQGFNGSFQSKSYFFDWSDGISNAHKKTEALGIWKKYAHCQTWLQLSSKFFCKWKEGNNKLLLRIKFTSRNAQYSLRLSVFLSFHFWQIILQLTNRHELTNHSTNLCRGKTWKLFWWHDEVFFWVVDMQDSRSLNKKCKWRNFCLLTTIATTARSWK